MTYYNYSRSAEKVYVPFDPKYSLDNIVAASDSDDLLAQKISGMADKIRNLYGLLYRRREINNSVVSQLEDELNETSSLKYRYKYNLFVDSRQKSSLDRKIDLLEKTKRTELVDYWKDSFKINIYLFQTIEEYKNLLNKQKLLQ